ncbi:MAG TPA: Gfo/Idh/MocA family oxidoreductase [Clostridiales bacterium]|nr:Gfo/Idh/MocA family oxidoreductase [Clostridiales bacterium]
MGKQIKYGMVGGDVHAFIGEVHRKAINYDTRAQLVAGCFSDIPEYNAETGEAYGVEKDRVYENYVEMAEKESSRPDGIDFVSIVTPNFLHYEMAKTFLEKGINVVCEKPLCFEIEQAQELKNLAEKKNLLFAVTYTYGGYTMAKVMKEMISEGKIGNIVAINAEYAQDWLLDVLSPEKKDELKLSIWRTNPKYSGISNCVGDIGTHIEYFVSYVTGLKIKRLLATTNTYGHALDLNSNIILEYENGVNGAYWCSQVAAGKLNGLLVRIYGDKGSLEWDQHYPDYLVYTPKDGAPQTLSRGCGYIKEKAASFSRLPCGHPEGFYVAFANIYKNYITALIDKKAGKTPSTMDFPTVEDGYNGVRFVHAVIESAKNGSTWVEME